MKSDLGNLISQMCDRTIEGSNNETVAYNAYRKIDEIKDENLLPILFDIVDNELDENKRDKAYYIISKIALIKSDSKSLNFLLQRLNKEKNKVIIENLLNIISSFEKPNETDLGNIFSFLYNKSKTLRYRAIQALKNCNSNECEDKLVYILENSTNHYDLLYTLQTLFSSGSQRSLSKIKEFINHSKQEISASALGATYNIAGEKELPLYIEQLKKGKNKFTALEGVVNFGNNEVIPNVVKRIKELISKKRNIEVVGLYGYTELIIAMNFLIKFPEDKAISEVYYLLEAKKDFLWESEKEWLKNNTINKGNH
ncbi:hypothetical protein [Flavobacterium saccharophilum]|uniref:HEAT repeat-containing protein n=1 Tax=Flavobacterium saccharophilum TaxID=29534 RepID=A0A1M7HNN9_9FLAO|nr:hypothetical protein [Flavobacterium saccharophilum]SHM30040.1 hypothetical protein SAMN05444366_2806 [Flavobacterium saccharophilum]